MSKNAEVVQGTCAPESVDTPTPLSAIAQKVRSVLVQPDGSNQGDVLIGYDTTTPVMTAPLSLGPVEGKFYNLTKVVIQIGTAGDKVTFIATK
jgi:hypothetical protein